MADKSRNVRCDWCHGVKPRTSFVVISNRQYCSINCLQEKVKTDERQIPRVPRNPRV